MKIFVAIVLLIAAVAALPLETEERVTVDVVPHPEGVAADALSNIAADIAAISVEKLLYVADHVDYIETNAPTKIKGLKMVLDYAHG